MGYFLKAYNYRSEKDFNNFYLNIKLGYDSAVKSKNIILQTNAANNLVFYKSIWGDKQVALNLQRNTHKLILSEKYKKQIFETARKTRSFNIDSLLSYDLSQSYHNLAHCFINLKKLDSASFYNRLLYNYVKENLTSNTLQYIAWSYVTEMEVNLYDKKYDEVKKLGDIFLKNDTIIEEGYFRDVLIFSGLADYNLNNRREAIDKLKRVDSMFGVSGMKDFLPHERLVYKRLLDNSRLEDNIDKQLYYLNKLLIIDSIQKSRYHFFEPKMIREYETPLLIAERESLISELRKQNQTPDPKLYITMAALTASLCLLFYYVRKRMVYKKRFEALLAGTSPHADRILHDGEYHNELSAEVVEDILEKLDRFERTHGFLNSDVTLGSLAKRCKTNSNYLSRVINLKREKNFSQYLHELRIGYAVASLLSKASYRKYTIKAIAEECGYNNAESFSKAFYRLHGIYPSYYIKKMEKSTG